MRAVALLLACVVGGAACTLVVELPEAGPIAGGGQSTEGGAGASSVGGQGGGAGATGGAGGQTGPCPAAGPPGQAAVAMALVDDPQGAYCIDEREVTFREYRAYYADGGPDYIAQHAARTAHCDWNQHGAPESGNGFSGWWAMLGDPAQADELDDPVRLVDWCDAHAYCARYGKRLCGARAGGGPMAIPQAPELTIGEWRYACSNGGVDSYPYGFPPDDGEITCTACTPSGSCDDSPDCTLAEIIEATEALSGSGICSDGRQVCTFSCTDTWLAVSEPAGSHPDCQTTAWQTYDMVGSAGEWFDGCDTNPAISSDQQACGVAGGYFSFRASWNTCAFVETFERSALNHFVGIRCCADPS